MEEFKKIIEKDNIKELVERFYHDLFPSVKSEVFKAEGDHKMADESFQKAILYFLRDVKWGHVKVDDAKEYLTNQTLYFFKNEKKFSVWDNHLHDRIDEFVEVNDEEKFAAIKKMFSHSIDTYMGARCLKLMRYLHYDRLRSKKVLEKMSFSSKEAVKTTRHKCKQNIKMWLKENEVLDIVKFKL